MTFQFRHLSFNHSESHCVGFQESTTTMDLAKERPIQIYVKGAKWILRSASSCGLFAFILMTKFFFAKISKKKHSSEDFGIMQLFSQCST